MRMSKKAAYGQHIRQIEHGVFTPLVFLSTGGIGREATISGIVDLLGDKPYPVRMAAEVCCISSL